MSRENRGTLITGKSGQGKSWLEGWLMEDLSGPMVILDPKDEHRGIAKSFLVIDRETYLRSRKMGQKEFWNQTLTKWPSIRVQYVGLTPEEMQDNVNALAWTIHERGNMTFVAGEYHRFAPNASAQLGITPQGLLVLHTDARTKQIDWIVSTQRPALLNTTVVTQANHRITFMMDDTNDVKRVASFFDGVDGVPSRDVIPRLPKRHCLIRDCDTGDQDLVDTNTLKRRIPHYG